MVVQNEGGLFLQGWAIVENTTEEDWDKVNLTLVSGRPISFRMDLYQPLYVNRPLVEMELYASLRPQAKVKAVCEKLKKIGISPKEASPSRKPAT